MKKYIFKVSRKAEKMLRDLPRRIEERIISKLEEYQREENPMMHAKKLTGYRDRYRFRVGDYRIICEKDDQGKLVILVVLKVKHRKDVYKD